MMKNQSVHPFQCLFRAGLICFALLLTAAGTRHVEAQEKCMTPESGFAFAMHLYEDEQWAAAATEFDRFVHFFPDDPRAPEAAFKIGMARFSLQRYGQAINAFEKVIRSYHESDEALESRFMISRCYQRFNDVDSAVQTLAQIIGSATDPQIRDRGLAQQGWLLLESGNMSGARAAFSAISEENRHRHDADRIVSALDNPGRIPQKSPGLAGLLSVVPGGGYLYTGRYREAGIAFFLTTALAAASWQCFDEDLSALGTITGLAGLGFYTGSIAGAITSAHKYNHRAGEEFVRRLKAEHGPTVLLQFQPKGLMLAVHCAF